MLAAFPEKDFAAANDQAPFIITCNKGGPMKAMMEIVPQALG